jgi:hypothetical protein
VNLQQGVLKKRICGISFYAVLLLCLSAASPWEGASAIAPIGLLPEKGYYAATNSFPADTVINIVNLETGSSVQAIVRNTSPSPGGIVLLSRETADAIGMRSSVGRVRLTPPSEAVAYARFIDGRSYSETQTGDPDFDPQAAINIFGIPGTTQSATPQPPPYSVIFEVEAIAPDLEVPEVERPSIAGNFLDAPAPQEPVLTLPQPKAVAATFEDAVPLPVTAPEVVSNVELEAFQSENAAIIALPDPKVELFSVDPDQAEALANDFPAYYLDNTVAMGISPIRGDETNGSNILPPDWTVDVELSEPVYDTSNIFHTPNEIENIDIVQTVPEISYPLFESATGELLSPEFALNFEKPNTIPSYLNPNDFKISKPYEEPIFYFNGHEYSLEDPAESAPAEFLPPQNFQQKSQSQLSAVSDPVQISMYIEEPKSENINIEDSPVWKEDKAVAVEIEIPSSFEKDIMLAEIDHIYESDHVIVDEIYPEEPFEFDTKYYEPSYVLIEGENEKIVIAPPVDFAPFLEEQEGSKTIAENIDETPYAVPPVYNYEIDTDEPDYRDVAGIMADAESYPVPPPQETLGKNAEPIYHLSVETGEYSTPPDLEYTHRENEPKFNFERESPAEEYSKVFSLVPAEHRLPPATSNQFFLPGEPLPTIIPEPERLPEYSMVQPIPAPPVLLEPSPPMYSPAVIFEKEIPEQPVITPPVIPELERKFISDALPRVQSLEKGKYYLQLGIFNGKEELDQQINGIKKNYPLVIQSGVFNGDKEFKLMVGPMNEGESNAVLLRFKRDGFKNAFIRHDG